MGNFRDFARQGILQGKVRVYSKILDLVIFWRESYG